MRFLDPSLNSPKCLSRPGFGRKRTFGVFRVPGTCLVIVLPFPLRELTPPPKKTQLDVRGHFAVGGGQKTGKEGRKRKEEGGRDRKRENVPKDASGYGLESITVYRRAIVVVVVVAICQLEYKHHLNKHLSIHRTGRHTTSPLCLLPFRSKCC